MRTLALLASFALLFQTPFRPASGARGFAPPHASPSEDPAPVRVVLEGVVREPDGLPAAGAVVVTSAGGKAVAAEDGRFRIEAEVPLDAESVQVTAIGRGGGKRIASTSVAPRSGAGSVPVGSLWLGQTACQPGWLPTFGQPGVDDAVLAMTVFDDGSGPALYAAGEFENAGGGPAYHVARWDGWNWHPLGAGTGPILGDFVRALAVYDDGSGPTLYAGGDFSGMVAKWNGVSWSTLGVLGGMEDGVRALAVYDDGSGPALYAGGNFDSAGGNATSGLARWDGSSWSTLGSGVSGGISTPTVYALAVHDDGSGPALFAGGEFTTVSGVSAVRIARWNGVGWTRLGNGLNQQVNALAVHDDGNGPKLYAGRNGAISRWSGTQWTSIGVVTGGSPPIISALETWDDGTGPALYVGGTFTSAGGTPANCLAKWNGTSWSALPSQTNGSVRALAAFDSGNGAELHAGGEFTSAGSQAARYLARWNGTSWRTVGDGLDGWVAALEVFDDGSGPALFAAGFFEHAGGSVVNSIVKWNGSGWEALGSGLTYFGGPAEPTALAAFDDGSGPALYAAGNMSHAGGLPVSGVARWNGSTWSAVGSGLGSRVFVLEVMEGPHGGSLYAGGSFVTQGSRGIARWTGSSWIGLGTGVDGILEPFENPTVFALAFHDDGSGQALYAGGNFLTAGGAPANRIARWNGASWSALGAGTNDDVFALASHDDGSGPALYAGGWFTSAGGIPANRVARWNGASWSALGSGINGAVRCLTTFDDGCGPALCAAGSFTLAGGGAANCIAQWDGTSWTALGSGMGGLASVDALQTFGDGAGAALYAGGYFPPALDSGDSFLARWSFDTAPPTLSSPTAVFRLDRLGTPPGEVVTFSVTAVDDRDPAPTVTCVPAAGSFFPLGTTVVTCTATDAAGNRASSEFPVTVEPKMRQR